MGLFDAMAKRRIRAKIDAWLEQVGQRAKPARDVDPSLRGAEQQGHDLCKLILGHLVEVRKLFAQGTEPGADMTARVAALLGEGRRQFEQIEHFGGLTQEGVERLRGHAAAAMAELEAIIDHGALGWLQQLLSDLEK